jgi:8-oxo-dGTP diphosphatase
VTPALPPRHYFIAAALIRRQGELLLVRQQGPDDEAPYWALPGGQIQEDEFLFQGLAREVREETGLSIREVGELAYTVRLDDRSGGYQSTIRVFEVAAWQSEPAPADPDQLVDTVAFFPLAAAIIHLRALPWTTMREPVVAYLDADEPAGTTWLYRPRGEDAAQLIARVASPARGKN